jgi:hypothetical protein
MPEPLQTGILAVSQSLHNPVNEFVDFVGGFAGRHGGRGGESLDQFIHTA